MLRRPEGDDATIIHSKEGVTQGDPLSMVVYGIGLLPLTLQLKREFPTMYQPWYADDAGVGATYNDIKLYFGMAQKSSENFVHHEICQFKNSEIQG